MEKNENGVVGQHDMSKPSRMDMFDPSWNDEGILEVVTFYKRYPKHIEPCLLKDFQKLRYALSLYRITYTLNMFDCCMTLSTARTNEPHIVRKAKELLQLLAVNIPADYAFRLFNGKDSYIIKIGHQYGGLCSDFRINNEQFFERKRLLWDSKEALAQVTSCSIFMQDEIVVIVGRAEGVKMVRSVVEDCIVRNEHPAPKIMSIERNLAMKEVAAMHLSEDS